MYLGFIYLFVFAYLFDLPLFSTFPPHVLEYSQRLTTWPKFLLFALYMTISSHVYLPSLVKSFSKVVCLQFQHFGDWGRRITINQGQSIYWALGQPELQNQKLNFLKGTTQSLASAHSFLLHKPEWTTVVFQDCRFHVLEFNQSQIKDISKKC